MAELKEIKISKPDDSSSDQAENVEIKSEMESSETKKSGIELDVNSVETLSIEHLTINDKESEIVVAADVPTVADSASLPEQPAGNSDVPHIAEAKELPSEENIKASPIEASGLQNIQPVVHVNKPESQKDDLPKDEDGNRGNAVAAAHSKQRQKKTAEDLKEEAVVARMEDWIVYSPKESTLDNWLNKYKPSQMLRENHIGWIAIQNDVDDEASRLGDHDLLEQQWETMKQSASIPGGVKINFDSICNLARECGFLAGKWICHVDTGSAVDDLWRKVATAMTGNGGLAKVATSAKVSPRNASDPCYKHLCSVHGYDFKYEEVCKLEKALRAAGVTLELKYKMDVYSHLGFYRNNIWGLRPTIYISQYNPHSGVSTITRCDEVGASAQRGRPGAGGTNRRGGRHRGGQHRGGADHSSQYRGGPNRGGQHRGGAGHSSQSRGGTNRGGQYRRGPNRGGTTDDHYVKPFI